MRRRATGALVHGGTSGIGTTAISLARLFGVKIIVTCGSDAKCAQALDLGATAAINYSTHDFAEETKRITGGEGVNVVLDMVGGDYFARNIASLADDGRHVSIATQRGMTAEINLMDVMRRRLTLTGSTLRPRSIAFKGAVADELKRHVWGFVESGQLRPVMDRSFPLCRSRRRPREDGGGRSCRQDRADDLNAVALCLASRGASR